MNLRTALPASALAALLVSAGCAEPNRSADRPAVLGALADVACTEAVADRLVAAGVQVPPRERPLTDGRSSLAFPTGELGSWLIVQPVAEGVVVAHAHPDGGERVTLDEGCEAGPPSVLAPADPPDEDAWTDAELAAALDSALERGRRGIAVYAWSPHMPLSLDGGPAIMDAAERMELDVYGILSPGSAPVRARTEAERVGLPAAWTRSSASIELALRDLWVHAPALIVFTDETVSPVMPGYRDADRYVEFLEDALGR